MRFAAATFGNLARAERLEMQGKRIGCQYRQAYVRAGSQAVRHGPKHNRLTPRHCSRPTTRVNSYLIENLAIRTDL
jgi:hypothetical protein